MGKLLRLVLIGVAMYIGVQVFNKANDGALRDAMDPIESSERDSSSFASHLIGDNVTMPTVRESGVNARDVRKNVKADMRRGVKRR